LREEVARHARHGHEFSLVVFEAQAGDGVRLRQRIDAAMTLMASQLRPSDVMARVFEDVVAVLLVETSASEANATLMRLRGRLVALGPQPWRVEAFNYPRDAAAIAALPVATAA
jgi:hypothetical protein